MEPVSSLLGVFADIGTAVKKGIPLLSGDAALTLSVSIGRNITSKPFGQGFQTMLDIINGGEKKGEIIKRNLARTASGFVPFSGFLRGIAKGIDPVKRRAAAINQPAFIEKIAEVSPGLGSAAGSLLDAIRVNTPFATFGLEPIMSVWGDTVITEEGSFQRMFKSVGIDSGMAGRILDGMANPINIRELTDDPATVEINRLMEATGETIKGLGDPQRYFERNGERIELSRENFIKYVQESGQRAHQDVLDLINHRDYSNMPDAEKQRLIEGRVRFQRSRVKHAMFGDIQNLQDIAVPSSSAPSLRQAIEDSRN